MCGCFRFGFKYGKQRGAVTDDLFEADEEEEKGGFSFRFTSGISAESKLLMNSLVFGLQNIEEDYGEPYIKIRFKEV